MIKHDGGVINGQTWGVSHNKNGIIVCLEDDNDEYCRVLLDETRTKMMIRDLTAHLEEFKSGTWCGQPMR